tara:strand:+ start:6343 stop:6780 length:438 start_codon:yes stop_codon:yes gene_type:complete
MDSFNEVEQYNPGMRIDDVPPMFAVYLTDIPDPTEAISLRQLNKLEEINTDTDVCYKCRSPEVTVRNLKSKTKSQEKEDLKPMCTSCFTGRFEREHSDYISEDPTVHRLAETMGFRPGLPVINMPPPTGDLLIHASFGCKLDGEY